MRTFLGAFCAFFLFVSLSHAQSEIASDLYRYDADKLQRIDSALEILDVIGAEIEDYDVVLYSERVEGQYQITFTSSAIFMEDGPRRGPDIEMLFDIETEALAGLIVHE